MVKEILNKKNIGIGIGTYLLLLVFISMKEMNVNIGLAILILSLLIVAFYSLYYLTMKETNVIELIKGLEKKEIVFVVLLIVLSNILVLSVTLKNRYLYFWDFGGYWGVSITHSQLIFENPILALQELYRSINVDEYNKLIPTLIALPLHYLGCDFEMYTLIVYNMFVVPAMIVICAIIKKIVGDKFTRWQYVLVFSTAAFFSPVLLGYLDAFSMLCIALVFLILSDGYLESYSIKKSVILGLCLLLSVIGRRYFAFVVVGIALAVTIVALLKLFTNKDKKEYFVALLKSAATIGFSAGIPAIVFFRDFLINSTSGTIAQAYSGYQSGTMMQNYVFLMMYYGALILILGVVGIAMMIKEKKIDIMLIMMLSLLITTRLFYSVQSMGNHHYYLTIVPIVVISAISLIKPYKLYQKIRYVIFSLVVILNILSGIGLLNLTGTSSMLLTNQKLTPQIRTDIPQIQSMANDLEELSNQGKCSYVIASSTIINDDIIRKVNMPDELISVPNLYVSSHVDLRDGFPVDFLTADIVLVADPVQTHLSEGSQMVIEILADEFISSKELSNNFQVVKIYTLDNGVTVTMYEKTQEFTTEQLDYLAARFDEFYSEYPDLFRNRIR